MSDRIDPQDIARVRRFNRFYTRLIGALQDRLLESDYNLPEVRVLYELAHQGRASASAIARSLSMDPGYLSRLVGKLSQRGLVVKTGDCDDGRVQWLKLSEPGEEVFAELDARSEAQMRGLLAPLAPSVRSEVIRAAFTLEAALSGTMPTGHIVLREPAGGELGWVVERHGAIYSQDFGWNDRFEALVAEIVADFAKAHDPRREACWIADLDGHAVGSVFLMRKDDDVAQLRLLLVEPHARGHGVGRLLVEQCIRFAQRKGYAAIELWTNDVLVAARRIYERLGFKLVARETHRRFGPRLEGQTWRLDLAPEK